METLDGVRAAFKEWLVERGLARHADALAGLVEPSIRLTTTGVVSEQDAPRVSTRLGGEPDVPEDFEWPVFKDEPLSFIAQVRLEEVAAFDQNHLLPPAGLLSFFYDTAYSRWGHELEDTGCSRVFFFPPGADLVHRSIPEEILPEGGYVAVAVAPSVEFAPAPFESSSIDRFGFTDDELRTYGQAEYEFTEMRYGEEYFNAERHRLLGNADPMQGDMQLECQLITNGVVLDSAAAYSSPRALELARTATDWRLLLQVDSGSLTGMEWGDWGKLYYWIRAQDLAERRFDRVWLILQCG